MVQIKQSLKITVIKKKLKINIEKKKKKVILISILTVGRMTSFIFGTGNYDVCISLSNIVQNNICVNSVYMHTEK
jgi:hypothetical protein